MSAAGVETELKVPVSGHEAVRRALAALGAVRTHELAREVNLLLDGPERRLAAAGCVLRLRRYGDRHLLTFKGKASFEGAVKSRVEHELEIEDGELMRRVLEAIGFEVVMRYDKDREGWRLDEMSIVLDRTPMGDFVEIEGPAGTLEAVARALGLDPDAAVRGSYVSLWQELRAAHPERDLPVDMVFPE